MSWMDCQEAISVSRHYNIHYTGTYCNIVVAHGPSKSWFESIHKLSPVVAVYFQGRIWQTLVRRDFNPSQYTFARATRHPSDQVLSQPWLTIHGWSYSLLDLIIYYQLHHSYQHSLAVRTYHMVHLIEDVLRIVVHTCSTNVGCHTRCSQTNIRLVQSGPELVLLPLDNRLCS